MLPKRGVVLEKTTMVGAPIVAGVVFFFRMGVVGVCHRRRFVFPRRAVYDGGRDAPLLRPPCIGTHVVLVGSSIAQTHRPQHS